MKFIAGLILRSIIGASVGAGAGWFLIVVMFVVTYDTAQGPWLSDSASLNVFIGVAAFGGLVGVLSGYRAGIGGTSSGR